MTLRTGGLRFSILFLALAVGMAAGWFAAGTARTEVPPVGRIGRDAGRPVGDQAVRPVAKPGRKAPIRSSANAEVRKQMLEKRVRFLEQGIRIAREKRAFKAADASNDELVESLMRIPTEWERDKALDKLGTNRLYSLTMAQLGRLCPGKYAVHGGDAAKAWHGRMVAKTAERLAILDSVDQSLMTKDERALHSDFVGDLARLPGLYAEKLGIEEDSADRTLGEVVENFMQLVSSIKRRDSLLADERKMLLSQAARHFDLPDDAAADLMATVDDVTAFTDDAVFFRKR